MNIEQIRLDTLGCEDKLFLNSAGAALPPKSVTQIMLDYQAQEALMGGYELEALKAADISLFYSEMATLLNCQPHNIAYAYSATDAYNKALSAIPFKAGDCILTSDDDYISNQLAFLSLQKRFQIEIVRASNLPSGELDLADFEELILRKKPVLVAITHVPTNSGLVQQAEEVGKLCAKYDVWYLLDACQSVGQMLVDVQAIQCDFLNATGRKFLRGPRATGFLYVSDKALAAKLEPLFIDRKGATWTGFDEYTIQASAKRFESQEISASLLGLAEAIRYVNAIGIKNIEARNQELASKLRSNLARIPSLELLDKGSKLCNIITFRLTDKTLEEVVTHLKNNKVNFAVSLKNYAIIDFTKKQVDWAIRFSPHYYNTFEEIDRVAEIVAGI
ncbi:MAG: aminotransferase class V-fold PLP-dependent enzyme [Flectobacillus sp.]|nr:aminotransferase class V-fold PLP-dependent enzyme [Flectobacillus sp.]